MNRKGIPLKKTMGWFKFGPFHSSFPYQTSKLYRRKFLAEGSVTFRWLFKVLSPSRILSCAFCRSSQCLCTSSSGIEFARGVLGAGYPFQVGLKGSQKEIPKSCGSPSLTQTDLQAEDLHVLVLPPMCAQYLVGRIMPVEWSWNTPIHLKKLLAFLGQGQ